MNKLVIAVSETKIFQSYSNGNRSATFIQVTRPYNEAGFDSIWFLFRDVLCNKNSNNNTMAAWKQNKTKTAK